MYPVGGGGGSVIHVPSEGWGRRISAMYPVGDARCDTCTYSYWGMMKERSLWNMYVVEDAKSYMLIVGERGGEEDLLHVSISS